MIYFFGQTLLWIFFHIIHRTFLFIHSSYLERVENALINLFVSPSSTSLDSQQKKVVPPLTVNAQGPGGIVA